MCFSEKQMTEHMATHKQATRVRPAGNKGASPGLQKGEAVRQGFKSGSNSLLTLRTTQHRGQQHQQPHGVKQQRCAPEGINGGKEFPPQNNQFFNIDIVKNDMIFNLKE